jgi:molecular chaperone DnaK (HSP70)
MSRVFGIDLGVSHARVAFVDAAGCAAAAPGADGEPLTPAALYLDGDRATVGAQARLYGQTHPRFLFDRVRPALGHPSALFECGGRSYRPEEAAALLLRRLAEDPASRRGASS